MDVLLAVLIAVVVIVALGGGIFVQHWLLALLLIALFLAAFRWYPEYRRRP